MKKLLDAFFRLDLPGHATGAPAHATFSLEKHRSMNNSSRHNTFEGRFLHLVYSPKGEHEGALIDIGGEPAQLVFDHHDAAPGALFQHIAAGRKVKVEATPQPPSPKGEAAHPVYAFHRLLAVDGKAPAAATPVGDGPAYLGKVVRLNHARHGEANGVVLDTGDFIHTKPDGMARLGLAVGDAVEADGDAQRLADDSGWAVEASQVNGRLLKAK